MNLKNQTPMGIANVFVCRTFCEAWRTLYRSNVSVRTKDGSEASSMAVASGPMPVHPTLTFRCRNSFPDLSCCPQTPCSGHRHSQLFICFFSCSLGKRKTLLVPGSVRDPFSNNRYLTSSTGLHMNAPVCAHVLPATLRLRIHAHTQIS